MTGRRRLISNNKRQQAKRKCKGISRRNSVGVDPKYSARADSSHHSEARQVDRKTSQSNKVAAHGS